MKLQLVLALSLLVACKKSDSAKADDPAPTATERPAPEGSARAEGSRLKKELDTNGDGVISDEERAAGRKRRVEKMRAKLDTNGDGKLTPEELGTSTGRMKFEHPEELDTNKDGDISVDELEVGLKARRDAKRGSGSAAEPAPE